MLHVVNSIDEDPFYLEYRESVSPYFECIAETGLDRDIRIQSFLQLLAHCERFLADQRADFSHVIFTDLSEAISEAAPPDREENGYGDTLLQQFLVWLEHVFLQLNDSQRTSLGSAFLHLAAEPPVDKTTEEWLASMLLTEHREMTLIAYELRDNFDEELTQLYNKWRLKISGDASYPFPYHEVAHFKRRNS
ncbi:hypothetical protein AB1L42_11105 [Thalassoglobus sp. JC818]|uniref:hypothetical protein n=1 Tax=Thalassoglobus sp. JC818 TaxID=3232136 RepID=UPI00345928B9